MFSGKTHVFFSTFLCFLHFRTRILTKNATCFSLFCVFETVYKGLAIRSQKQYTFEKCIVLHKEAKMNTLLNLHKETTGFDFHYWRRREPPVPLRGGEFRSSFAILNTYFMCVEHLQQ